MPAVQETVERVRLIDVDQYKYGFETLIESEKAPKGLNEDTVRCISGKKNEPEILKTYEKLGIPLREQELLEGVVRQADGQEGGGADPARRVAVDAVFDSVSVATTFKHELKKAGVIFMPISEAVREHPDLVQKYLGTVVPTSDNFFATLNSAVFSDGSFVYVPPRVRCPMELSTYFRINEKDTGQFERT